MLIFKNFLPVARVNPTPSGCAEHQMCSSTPSGILLNGGLLGDKWIQELSAFTKLKSNNISPCSYAPSRCLSATHSAFLHNNVFMNQLHYCLAISFMSQESQKKHYFCIFLSTIVLWIQDNFSDNAHKTSMEGTVTVPCTPSSMS